MKIHVEIWIAAQLLSKEKQTFTKKELTNKIINNFNDRRKGVSTHISSYCVASTRADPGKYRYLTRVGLGRYQVFQEGDVTAQLDFIDKTTFGYLDSIPKKCGIKIITSNIKDRGICKRRAQRCAKDRPHFSIIEISKIHQRWIGSTSSFFIEIGTDLKTDALGRSTHTIRRVNPIAYDETQKHFDKLWKTKQKALQEIYGADLIKSLFIKG